MAQSRTGTETHRGTLNSEPREGELGDQKSPEADCFVLFEPKSCLPGPVSVHFTPF
jgi:hypothetical protein